MGEAVDFVTIHTLPYWEDEPTAIEGAVAHVERIRQQIAREFPDKRIFIGEAGWPSAGRMREGALPSIVNQARFVREMMALADAQGIGLNLIESFDQPWKRRLEGTVGGHWGLLDAQRQPKFALDRPSQRRPRLASALRSSQPPPVWLLLVPAMLGAPRLRARAWIGLALGAAAAGSLLVLGIRDGLPGIRTVFDWTVFAVRLATGGLAAVLVLEALARSTGAARPLPMASLIDGLTPPSLAERIAAGGSVGGGAGRGLCSGLRRPPSASSSIRATATLRARSTPCRRSASWRWHSPRAGEADERRRCSPTGARSVAGDGARVGGFVVAWREGLANHQALAWMAMALVFAAAIAVEPPASAQADSSADDGERPQQRTAGRRLRPVENEPGGTQRHRRQGRAAAAAPERQRRRRPAPGSRSRRLSGRRSRRCAAGTTTAALHSGRPRQTPAAR